MINAIPVIGWLLSAILATSLAVPFFFIWNALAPTYFYFLPAVYLTIPFWDCVGLFMIIPIVKSMLMPRFSYPVVSNPKKS
jgi:hypothetical protein